MALRLLCAALPLVALQAIALPYTPRLPEKCRHPGSEHYVDAINKCCSSCPPGSRVLRSCNATVDTQCAPCEEGTYTQVWSRAERCLGCIPPCKSGLAEVRACSATQNRRCWCPPRHVCRLKLSEETCLHCEALPACARGYGAARPGTSSGGLECRPCRPGTFSDGQSSTAECKPHTACKAILIPGNSTSDNVCREPRGAIATTPPETLPPGHFATHDPVLGVGAEAPADMSAIAGWVAGAMFALFALTCGTLLCFAFRNRGQPCAFLHRNEKQPFPAIEKRPGGHSHDARSPGQEEQNLLETSASSSSGSLERMQASESGSNASTPQMEEFQPRGPLFHSCVSRSIADSKQCSSGRTHVNVSCVVRVCRSDHTGPSQPPSAGGPGALRDVSLADDDLPLSKEESPGKREPGRQVAVEVEDHVGPTGDREGQLLRLDTQEAGARGPNQGQWWSA